MTAVIMLSVAVIALVMLAMAIGAMFSNRCLRGSCGGPEVLGPDGQSLSCDTCPLRRQEGAAAVPSRSHHAKGG